MQPPLLELGVQREYGTDAGVPCCVSNVLGDDVSIIDAVKRQEVVRIKVGKMPKRLVVASVPK